MKYYKGKKILMRLYLSLVFTFFMSQAIADDLSLMEMIASPEKSHIDKLQQTPLDSIFNFDRSVFSADKHEHRRILNVYRGFHQESVGLVNYCSLPRKVEFASYGEELLFSRNIVATLQYIGIMTTIPAISEYVKRLHYTEVGVENLIDNLIGNYCSSNFSLMSIKKLRTMFLGSYRKAEKYKIPSLKNNPFFPKKLDVMNSNEGVFEHELFYTVELFKSFCSWGGDPTDLRLMTSLLKSPLVFSYLIREMTSKKLDWKAESQSITLVDRQNPKNVLCDGFICRPVSGGEFRRKIQKSVGSDSLRFDLQNRYCNYFSTANAHYPQVDPRLERMMKDRTQYDESFLVAQFTALMTGIPDLLIRAKHFQDIFSYLDNSLDEHFDKWAKRELDKMTDYLYYEDSIRVKKMDRKLHFNYKVDHFAIWFDVSLGEWDRSVAKTGKMKMSFDLHFPHALAQWVRHESRLMKGTDIDKEGEIEKRVVQQIISHRKAAQSKLRFPLWSDRIDKILAKELIEQLTRYKGKPYNARKKDTFSVPVTFFVGPFALKYLNYKYKVDKEEKKLILSN